MSAPFVEVAVPVPVAGPLTYAVPPTFETPRPGVRVRVPVGKRQLTGVVVALRNEPPAGVEARAILEVLDLEPVVGEELLALARFISDYYLAPIGDAVRIMIPADLPPWGNRRVSLTNAGALAPPRSLEEGKLIEHLLAHPRARLAELQQELRIPRLARLVDELQRLGRLSVEEPGRRGTRYVKAVELRPGDREAQLELCGRSPQGREVVEYLSGLGRPATLRELTTAVGCGAAVVRRLSSLGLLREFTQPERLSLRRHRLGEEAEKPELVLRDDQADAVEQLTAALTSGEFTPFLLGGATGSGKTEVYLQAVATALARGRGAILLVPEIALVPALARLARQRFGNELAILHSNLSGSERAQEWERLRSGEARVVLGPRSALLAPVANLGVVVVDEEHDAAYKQDVVPRYNGRDLALLRARDHGAVAILVSATPSLESRHNVAQGKLQPLTLTARVGAELPLGILVDLRQEKVRHHPGEVHFSARLTEEIATALTAGDQVILLRNRRGYAPILLCRACGEDHRCEDCGLPMTLHRRLTRLVCHYCGQERAVPGDCAACGQKAIEPIGAGTERVEERFRELFPEAAVDVLDADASRRAGGAAAVLERFATGQTQVLVGTQMVAKGHDFPRVALAAVMSADTYLGFPDFRAVEKTYALLTQLAGRAGRGDRPGRVVIQTFHPDHYAIRAALERDDAAFVREEMRFRQTFHYPPFTRMICLLARHPQEARARAEIQDLARRLAAHPLAHDVLITGPAPAPLERLRGKYRHQLLLRSAAPARLRQLVREVTAEVNLGSELVIDVDPYDLL